jgi:hypothetical protein
MPDTGAVTKWESRTAGRGSFAVLILAVLLLVGSSAFAVVQRDRSHDERDQQLATAVRRQAADLENYFERARSIILLTARNPAFARFYEEPGSRLAKIERKGRAIREVNDALAYLESLYPTSIGEACFIDYTGPENARVVRGERAALEDLSPDESGNPFFKPTFALKVGEVYQAAPYVSPDRGVGDLQLDHRPAPESCDPRDRPLRGDRRELPTNLRVD